MSLITIYVIYPQKVTAMPSFYISFLNFKKTAIDSFVHRQVGLQCYISEPGGGNGGSFPWGFCLHDSMM